jgi:acetoacetyl-CoA synthetase
MKMKTLWTPTEENINNANITQFITWVNKRHDLALNNYADLWQWSVDEIEVFWEAIVQYLNIELDGEYDKVISSSKMPGVRWFEGTRINYTEQLFRQKQANSPALIFESELKEYSEISWDSLEEQVATIANFLRSQGVKQGDRVVAFMPNIPQTVVTFLAVASIGAVYSSCSPDFGAESVIERFKQIEPVFMIAVDGYRYNGKDHNKVATVEEIMNAIPDIKNVLIYRYLASETEQAEISFDHYNWDKVLDTPPEELVYTRVEFNDPLWVLYSSGTTGLPKAITQSHGGIVIEHSKYLHLNSNCNPGSRFFWYSTTGWMMWNFVMGSLLVGSAAILYDGAAAYPDINRMWEFAEKAKVETFGTSAAYIMACKKAGIVPKDHYDLSALKSIGSTGSPLPVDGFLWVYENIGEDIWLNSVSGGTDICSVFVGGSPTLPVQEGVIQCRALGANVESFDEQGAHHNNTVGEMVISTPMPSMPIYFWGDKNNERYLSSYFEMYEGVWRHGDWIEFNEDGGAIIHGRSDSTLNRGGIRIGTAEIYSAVENIPEITDSLIIGLELKEGKYYMPLFVKLKAGLVVTDELSAKVKSTLRQQFTPRHVPDELIEVEDIPYTLSGKKMETPIKKIFMGKSPDKVLNKDAMKNPDSMDYFIDFYSQKIQKM